MADEQAEEAWPTCVNLRTVPGACFALSSCWWDSGLEEADVLVTQEV